MKQDGFEQRYKKALDEAMELANLWTNTPIADKIEFDVQELKIGVRQGYAEQVTDELFPQLRATLRFAEEELIRTEG